MKRLLIGLALLLASSSAWAGCSVSYPFTLVNGTLADANQVMSDFNAILPCINTTLASTVSPTFTGTPKFIGRGDNPSGGAVGTYFASDSGVIFGSIAGADVLQIQSFTGSTTGTSVNADNIGTYQRNQVANLGSGNSFFPEGIGIFDYITCEVMNCNSFAIATQATDYFTPPTSFTGGIIHSYEMDTLVSNTNTVATGLTVTGLSTAQGSEMEAVRIDSPSSQSVGTVKWTHAFLSDDDCCSIFEQIGAVGAVGNNVNSQQVLFNTYDGGGSLKQFALTGVAASGIGSFDLTSGYTNFNVGIGTTTPVNNTGSGFTGLTISGTTGGVASLVGSSVEYGRLIGSTAGLTLEALNNSTGLTFQTGSGGTPTNGLTINTSQQVNVPTELTVGIIGSIIPSVQMQVHTGSNQNLLLLNNGGTLTLTTVNDANSSTVGFGLSVNAFSMNGTAGVNCTGVTAGTVVVTLGIVTHC